MELPDSREFCGSLSTCKLGILAKMLHKAASVSLYAPFKVKTCNLSKGPAAANAFAAASVKPRPQNVSSSLSSLSHLHPSQSLDTTGCSLDVYSFEDGHSCTIAVSIQAFI